MNKRKTNRLQNWDYSSNGVYYVTVCIEKRKNILCNISSDHVGDGFPVPQLTWAGKIVDDYIKGIDIKYPEVCVDYYVIMPNHIHLLVAIDNNGTGNPSPTLGNIIGWFKYNSTKEINLKSNRIGEKLWQRSYYDHIIRNEADYYEKRQYIENNPAKWRDDEYYE